MKVTTAYGTVYGIETLAEAGRIIAEARAEAEHEGCPICRGGLTLTACVDAERQTLWADEARVQDGFRPAIGNAERVRIVARMDAWARFQPARIDPLADTAALFGL